MKDEIIAKYQPFIDEAQTNLEVARLALETITIERDVLIAQAADYEAAMEQKARAEEIIAKGPPKLK